MRPTLTPCALLAVLPLLIAADAPRDLDWWSIANTHLPISQQRRLAVEKALSVPPTTPIGKFSYSNISFVLLGAIIEAKTGMTWEEAMTRDIFNHCTWTPPVLARPTRMTKWISHGATFSEMGNSSRCKRTTRR